MLGSQEKDATEVVANTANNEVGDNSDKPKENDDSSEAQLNRDSTPKKNETDKTEVPKTPGKDDQETGASLLAQGKRHLYVKDYPSAASILGDACAKLSEMYGDKADECADAYYHYGCALLELAREEIGVLGEVENKGKDSEESDEEAGEEEVAADDEEEEKEEGAKTTEDADKVEKSDGDKKEEESEVEIKEADQNEENAESEAAKEGGEDEDEDEDVNNLQLAWEIFELAKLIFEREKCDKKLADTYLKLGEVAMESENYGSAIDDMNKCLEIQQRIFAPDNRSLAETLFQLGVASSLCNQFNEAIKYFTNAGVILERRIRNLSTRTVPDPEQAKNPFYSIDKEIEEIKGLLPEIKDKIADMEDFKNESLKAIKASLGEQSGSKDGSSTSTATNGSATASTSSATIAASSSSSAVTASSPAKAPANDISHLIRKKRKAEDEVAETNDTKKANVETK